MILSHSLFLFAVIYFAAPPSAAQSSSSSALPSGTTAPQSGTSSAPSGSTVPATSFANLTTTNAQGSTTVISIPITVNPSTTPTATSSAPYPSLTGYPACVTDCLTYAVAQVNCTSITDVACYCPSRIFIDGLYACAAANCSASVPSAESLAQKFCTLDNTTLSFSSTAAAPHSASAPLSTQPSASASSGSKPFNAAPAALWTPGDTRGWTAMAVAACGVVVGAALF